MLNIESLPLSSAQGASQNFNSRGVALSRRDLRFPQKGRGTLKEEIPRALEYELLYCPLFYFEGGAAGNKP